MSFGNGGVPDNHVVRTFRVKVMATPGKKKRARALLVSGGDTWAWCIDRSHARTRSGLPSANSLGQMWPDQKAHGPFGELSVHCAQDVTKAWSASFFETMRRKKAGKVARLPLRKRWLVPVTWRTGEFRLAAPSGDRRATVVLQTARGNPSLVLSLSHDHPYDPRMVRAARLADEAGELFMDITARVAVVKADVLAENVAGVDPGVIHLLALAAGCHALLISGRAVRAEEFLHLRDSKARQKRMAAKRVPRRAKEDQPREFGSRRWKELTRSQQRSEARNRRVVRLANNRAARLALAFLVRQEVGVVVIGNPTGIEHNDAGAIQNRRVWRWARTHQRDALTYRLEEKGIEYALVNERGTSSACPSCGAKATKRGRKLACTSCQRLHHRDVAGAQNMVKKLGHVPLDIARIQHRRVGTPSRRDRRRHLYDVGRGLARTRAATPSVAGVESLVASAAQGSRWSL